MDSKKELFLFVVDFWLIKPEYQKQRKVSLIWPEERRESLRAQ